METFDSRIVNCIRVGILKVEFWSRFQEIRNLTSRSPTQLEVEKPKDMWIVMIKPGLNGIDFIRILGVHGFDEWTFSTSKYLNPEIWP